MAESRKSDSTTKAQRKFEELLRRTEAALKEQASQESEAGKEKGSPKKDGKD